MYSDTPKTTKAKSHFLSDGPKETYFPGNTSLHGVYIIISDHR